MFRHQGDILRASFISKEYKYTTPLQTTHFTRFVWARSLRITKIETDVRIHTAYRLQIATNLYLEQLSHSFNYEAYTNLSVEIVFF